MTDGAVSDISGGRHGLAFIHSFIHEAYLTDGAVSDSSGGRHGLAFIHSFIHVAYLTDCVCLTALAAGTDCSAGRGPCTKGAYCRGSGGSQTCQCDLRVSTVDGQQCSE